MAIYYVDPVNGNDLNNGTSFALRKKTISSATSVAGVTGDEIRVMQSGNPVNIGNGTWRSDFKYGASNITGFSTTTGAITLSSSQTWNVGDYVAIYGNTRILRNGLKLANDVYKLLSGSGSNWVIDWNPTGTSDLGTGSLGSILKANGAIVELDDPNYIKELNVSSWTVNMPAVVPSSWKLTTIGSGTISGAAGQFAWISGTFDPAQFSNSAAASYMNTTYKPIPGTAYRITFTGQYSTTAIMTTTTYTNYDPNGWTSFATSPNGFQTQSYNVSTGFSYSWAGSLYSSIMGVAGSYVEYGGWFGYNTQTSLSTGNPAVPKQFVTAGSNNSCTFLGTKTTGTSPNRIFSLLWRGNNTAPFVGADINPNMIIEYKIFEATTGYGSGTVHETHIHANANFEFTPDPPSVTSGTESDSFSKWGIGYRVNMQSATTGSLVATADLGGPLDLSSYRTISFAIRLNTGATINETNTQIRLYSSDGSYILIPINLESAYFNSGYFTTIDYVHPTYLPNDIVNIQIWWIGATTAPSTASFFISNFIAGKDEFGLKKLIGRNLSDSVWYRFQRVLQRYSKTLFVLSEASDTTFVQSYGATHLYGSGLLNSQTTPEVFTSTPIWIREVYYSPATNNTISNSNDKIITGGWDSTNMSTVVGKTFFLSPNPKNSNGFNLNAARTILENFGLYNYANGLFINVAYGCRIKNCDIGYNTYGIQISGSSTIGMSNIRTVGNLLSSLLSATNPVSNVDIYDYISECDQNLIGATSVGNTNINLYKTIARGCSATGVNLSNFLESTMCDIKILAQTGGTPCITFDTSHNNYISELIMSRQLGNGATPLSFTNSGGNVIREFSPESFITGIGNLSSSHVSQQEYTNRNILQNSNSNLTISPNTTYSFSNFYTTTVSTGISTNCFSVYYYGSSGSFMSQQNASRIKMAEVPVIFGNLVTVSIKAKPSTTGVYGRLDIDLIESDIGIVGIGTTNPGVDLHSTINVWSDYSFTFEPLKTGVAIIYLNTWYDGSSGKYLWVDEFKIV